MQFSKLRHVDVRFFRVLRFRLIPILNWLGGFRGRIFDGSPWTPTGRLGIRIIRRGAKGLSHGVLRFFEFVWIHCLASVRFLSFSIFLLILTFPFFEVEDEFRKVGELIEIFNQVVVELQNEDHLTYSGSERDRVLRHELSKHGLVSTYETICKTKFYDCKPLGFRAE